MKKPSVDSLKKGKEDLELDIAKKLEEFVVKYQVNIKNVKVDLKSYYPGIYQQNWDVKIKIEL